MKLTDVLGGPDYIKLMTGGDVMMDSPDFSLIRIPGGVDIELRTDMGYFEVRRDMGDWIVFSPHRSRRYVVGEIRKRLGVDFDPFHAIVEPNGKGLGIF